ncbi:MAG: hypothetical protein ACJAV5_001372 [Vicingaceae bacterium]|jgi:hypothetical protein
MKINVFVLLTFLISSVELQAQKTVLVAGGDAIGSGGTSSFTVGQVVYTTNTGSNGSVAQGVQQPYEVSIVIGINETTINLEIAVYPNPTTNNLTLKIDDFQLSILNFQLIDLQGRVIENKKVVETYTDISVQALPQAIYFLNVIRNNQVVKTFKVIKQ